MVMMGMEPPVNTWIAARNRDSKAHVFKGQIEPFYYGGWSERPTGEDGYRTICGMLEATKERRDKELITRSVATCGHCVKLVHEQEWPVEMLGKEIQFIIEKRDVSTYHWFVIKDGREYLRTTSEKRAREIIKALRHYHGEV